MLQSPSYLRLSFLSIESDSLSPFRRIIMTEGFNLYSTCGLIHYKKSVHFLHIRSLSSYYPFPTRSVSRLFYCLCLHGNGTNFLTFCKVSTTSVVLLFTFLYTGLSISPCLEPGFIFS